MLLKKMFKIIQFFLVGTMILACGKSDSGNGEKQINVGALFDLTGPTSDVGWHYTDGIRDYIQYVNEKKGGIGDGVKINLIWTDYQYKIPQAISAYSKFVKQDKVVAIIGWGTGDTEALKSKIIKDQIPFTSGSFSQHLVWPPKWNFLPITTYADHVRIVMKYFRDNWQEARNPRMALVYNDSGYGKAVLKPAREYAKEIGIDLVAEEVVGLRDLEATSQMLRIKEKKADFVYMQETYTATSTVLKEAKKHGMTGVTFTGNYWGTGQKLAELAGEAAEGYLGIMPFAIWTDEGEGVEFAKLLNTKYQPDVEYREGQYMTGIVNAMMILRGIEIALENAGGDPAKVAGANVFKGLESLKEFDTLGMTSPISFSASEHRGAKKGRLVTIKNGQLIAATGWLDAPPVPQAEMRGE